MSYEVGFKFLLLIIQFEVGLCICVCVCIKFVKFEILLELFCSSGHPITIFVLGNGFWGSWWCGEVSK